jgi:hypothetical protein
MAQYRKKPVVIEAQTVRRLIEHATYSWNKLPHWFREAYEAGGIVIRSDGISISTPEGVMNAEPTDWIIRGVKGELYPCKPDIFEVTYELEAG